MVTISRFAVDKVAIPNDILRNKLKKGEITEIKRQEIQRELALVEKRWVSGRSQNAVGEDKRPLLTSKEWIGIQVEKRLGRNA